MLTTLDEVDICILSLLQNDARLSNKEIADKVGKSVSPVYERIKRLEQLGIIRKYVALLESSVIDKGLAAFTHVQLKYHGEENLLNFERHVVVFPEVMECYHMSGEFDYLLKVVVKDMNEYHQFILNKLTQIANIAHIQSFFVFSEAKKETAFKLAGPLHIKPAVARERRPIAV